MSGWNPGNPRYSVIDRFVNDLSRYTGPGWKRENESFRLDGTQVLVSFDSKTKTVTVSFGFEARAVSGEIATLITKNISNSIAAEGLEMISLPPRLRATSHDSPRVCPDCWARDEAQEPVRTVYDGVLIHLAPDGVFGYCGATGNIKRDPVSR